VRTWLLELRTFLARHPGGWEQPRVTTSLLKNNKPVADEPIAIADNSISPLRTELKRGESLRLVLEPAPGRIAALRLEAAALPAANPDSKKAANRAPLRVTAVARSAGGRDTKLDFVFADATEKEPRYENGDEVLGIVSGWKLPLTTDKPLRGTWLFARPHRFTEGETLVLTLTGEAVPALRVYTSPLSALDPLAVAAPAQLAALQSPDATSRHHPSPATEAWLLGTAANSETFDRLHSLMAQIRETREGRAWSLITQPMEPLMVRVLPRGNWQDESGAIVLPATPSFLPARRESTPEHRLTRLDLANWIVSRDNPITARVVMNRLWAMFFGAGLSAVVDDLGSQGELPSHPELLDWLACEFRDRGWDLRHMIRLIVTSTTFRQSSSLRPELRERDPANRFLASQNPRRLEAEFIRDAALFAAGLLNHRDLGGPSVKPYQPPGYYAALQFPNRDYVASHDDEQWRRGVYMHWQRTFLHPMLANFDAPARDECAAARTVSNTPQQALTLLNDPTFVEAARVLAVRVIAAGADDTSRLRYAFRQTLGRDPKPQESAPLLAFLGTQRELYRDTPEDARKLMHVGLTPAPEGDVTELAAWTQVTRAVLNTQEFITRY
jgi:hypothetical protein